jgi:hypothetical protein
MRNIIFFLITAILIVPAFASAAAFEFRKEYSGNIVDGMREMVFANTTVSMSRGDYFKFQFKPGGEYYNYKILSGDGENVTFLMPLNRQITITKGNLREVDTDADGNYDLGIYVMKAYLNGGAIIFSPIAGQSSGGTIKDLPPYVEPEKNDTPLSVPEETVSPAANESSAEAETEKKTAAWPFLLIGILAVSAIAVFLLTRKKKRF